MLKDLSFIYYGLVLHILVLSPLLFVIFLKLRREGLFNWLSAGFWALGSMALYYMIVPLVQFLGNPFMLDTRLAATGGLSRMIWVTFCLAVGISVFFLAYFRTRPGQPRFSLPQDSWPPGTWGVLVLALLGAIYSLITYRGAFGFKSEETFIVGGQYVGNVTGYAVAMHLFASFVIVLLILRRSTRVWGYGVLGLYLMARLADAWDRQSAVGMLLGVSMVATALRARKWPPRFWIAIVLAFTLLMWVRGHVSFTEARESGGLSQKTLTEQFQRGDDVSVLSQLYLTTYIYEKAGYTYGVPLVSGLLFGPLPRKYFPWKDWLAAKIHLDYREIRNPEILKMAYGGKDTVIGEIYGWGNLFGVVIGMALMGFLTRKLDGWVSPQAPMAARAMGFVWLGSYYMMYASGPTWNAGLIFLTGLPFVGVVMCAKIFGSGRKTSESQMRQQLASSKPVV